MIDIQLPRQKLAQQTILQNINLQVDQGECFGLIGLNGAGKTTLIRLLLNFLQCDMGGRIAINAIPADCPASRETVIYLPEKFNPPNYLNGVEYLDYIVTMHHIGINKNQKLALYQKLADKLALDTLALNQRISRYSKGMVQKLGIMGCLLSDKPLLILDEPMSGLDPQARVLFRQVIAELKQQQKTVLLSTHLLDDVQTLCDRVAVLHQGRLFFIGTPVELCQTYQADNLEMAFLSCLNDKSRLLSTPVSGV